MNPQKVISFLLVLLFSLSLAQTEHDHSDPDAMTGAKANTLELDDLSLEINPMLLPDGSFRLGFIAVHLDTMSDSTTHDHSDASADEHDHSEDEASATDEHASDESNPDAMHDEADHDDMASDMTEPLNLSITTPSGKVVSLEGDVMNALSADLGRAEAGMYEITGTVGMHELQSSVSVYSGKTDLDSDIYVILAPTPSVSGIGLTEAFIYAATNGESIHTKYLVSRKMTGMTHMTDEEVIELEHNHFEAFSTADFEPAGNEAAINFPMAGNWEFTVTLMSSVPETASFTVAVLDK